MATRKKPCNEEAATVQRGLPPAYYHLHALLHTIRSLQCHEDDLCTLITEIQRSGRIGPRLHREITELLNNLPVASLEAELHGAFSAIDKAAA